MSEKLQNDASRQIQQAMLAAYTYKQQFTVYVAANRVPKH